MIKALQRALSCGVCIPLLAFAAPLWADAGDIATLLDQTQPKKALTASDAWLKDHPDDAQVRFLRGRALAAVGRTDDAIEVFAAMASADPQLPGPANNLAVLYAHQGKYEEARRWLEAAMQTSPAYAIAHRNLGDVYTALAALAYSKALEPDGQPRALGVQLEMVARLHQSRPAAA
ncbi:MAG: tetratricopeptide repeat protein, partial [Salinisphaera sp.]|nr:tetratricopeptide repeat protein [Salinisphaera sp.]